MAGDNALKDSPREQSMSDKHFLSKAENLNIKKGKKIMALKGKNKLVGLVLASSVVGI
ncbi:hypothetical protein BgiMline_026502, partial [Biomphalaria glabrata]